MIEVVFAPETRAHPWDPDMLAEHLRRWPRARVIRDVKTNVYTVHGGDDGY